MVTDRDKMIENNIGLVHSIANRFKGRGVDYDDLFQSGCVGLIKAVDNFDESRGFAFLYSFSFSLIFAIDERPASSIIFLVCRVTFLISIWQAGLML